MVTTKKAAGFSYGCTGKKLTLLLPAYATAGMSLQKICPKHKKVGQQF
jgi:hypothetical protein